MVYIESEVAETFKRKTHSGRVLNHLWVKCTNLQLLNVAAALVKAASNEMQMLSGR
jgi:hypothetical protein